MRTASFLALALMLSFTCTGRTTAQPKGAPKKPLELYSLFRTTMGEGKFDISGIYLEEFLKSNPTDNDFLEIEKKYGTTVFQQLRAIPKYSDDPATEKKIRATIEEINNRAKAAMGKLLYKPERVQKYIRNLGATYEEKIYAQQELKRTGDYAIPFMVDAIRQNPDPDLYAGILETIPVLEGPTIAGWVAALDGLGVDRQYGVLEAIARRRDILSLVSTAQTDITPYLWRILSRDPKNVPQNLRNLAVMLLNRFYPGIKADVKRPEGELITIARAFYDHKVRYLGVKSNPDGSPSLVPLWITKMDGVVLKLEYLPDVPARQADEYYGLRYARWALESKPDSETAQALIIALAAERAVERAKFTPLATSEPAVYKLLADAPSNLLNDLLARGLAEKRTTLVLAMVQILGDRVDRLAATVPAGPVAKPSLLVQTLSYPDPAVQFAAASALLRSPVPVPPASRRLIVDILRRASAADPGAPGEAKGTVLLADPKPYRSDQNAFLLRSLGFTVEQFPTGRTLLRRIAKASDFDLIFVDYHTPDPLLIDLVSQLQSDVKASARPVFVIASSDKPRVPTFDQLLITMAALIAATENDPVAMPAPYVPDLRFTPEERAADQKKNQETRDVVFRQTAQARAERLQRVIDTLPLTLSEQQQLLMKIRIQLLQYALLGAEFPISPESSPETVAEIRQLRKQLSLQPPSQPYGVGAASTDLMKLIQRFELDVAKVKIAQDKYDFLRARVDPADLGVTIETFRDPALETKLARTLQNYPAVRIIPEPYSRFALESELSTLFTDPMKMPRNPSVKKAEAKQAIEFLRLMAMGDLPGYDLTSAEGELREALNVDDLASAAIDAVERFKSSEAQQALLRVALKDVRNRATSLRLKAADAAIRHIRVNGSQVPQNLIEQVKEQANTEPDAELRGKFLTLKGMLAFKPGEFVDQLKGYSPPILPPTTKKEPEQKKEPELKKEPEPNPNP